MPKGICRLSVVPVRKEPSDRSEMVTQLLFGDHYSVLEESEDKKWIHLSTSFDDYDGWIDNKQHKTISEEYFEDLNSNDYKICTDITSTVLYMKKPLQIVIGSVLPIAHSELFDLEEQFAFNGESKNMGQKRDFEFLRTVAYKYINAPYLWGGKSPFGIDCSGFVQMAFKLTGYKLKRDTSQQVQQGMKIKSYADALPGDLAFFHNKHNEISHVGVILEDYKIIHASGYVRVDFLDERGIFNQKNNNYSHQLVQIKRILR